MGGEGVYRSVRGLGKRGCTGVYKGGGRGSVQECMGIREEGVYGGGCLGQRGEEDMGRYG